MLISVTIEHEEPDCRAKQVLVEANDAHEAAQIIIDAAKTMTPKYNFRVVNDTTYGGKEYTFIYADEPQADEDGYTYSCIIAKIPKQEKNSMESIKMALRTTGMFDRW